MIDTLFKTIITNDEEKYCVYCHRNKINGKRYIGQTKQNIERRWGDNGCNYKGCIHFNRAINKYGWNNFEHYIIQDGLTKEEADELEKLNILAYNTTNANFGYNIDKGGSHGGHPHTEETKAKMSKSKKGNKNSVGKPNTKGYKWVHNTIENILVPPNKVQEYLDKGYILGHNNFISNEQLKKIGERKKGNTYCKGRIRVNNGIFEKMIYPNQLQEYLDNGFVKGTIMTEERREKCRASLGKTPWNKGISCKYGKKIGDANRNRTYMHKDGKNTTVKPDDIDKYLSDGWIIGRLSKKEKEKYNDKL